MVLSLASLSTLMLSTPSVLMLPANTLSPTVLLTGMLSPVTGLSSKLDVPLRMMPSAGTLPPGRTCTVCPTRSESAGTSRVWPFSSSSAVLGASAESA